MHADERLEALMGPGGIPDCGNAQNCVQVCPKEIPLTTSIAAMNREVTKLVVKDLFFKDDETEAAVGGPRSVADSQTSAGCSPGRDRWNRGRCDSLLPRPGFCVRHARPHRGTSMKIHEYQGKELFRKYGVPDARAASSPPPPRRPRRRPRRWARR